ncbi:MAG: Coenzyme F420 hydrogenase/dehydrogenase, beta subunit C-terminal domain [Firmicutes bacterium]|nr:Coenzyme F420 hydrogenase/dehydrogenase, beta subunit C-terminal domain [Bacillota bacterium]
MIHIDRKEDCCGCGACANVCPKNCIQMTADKEGFLYPNINKDTCVDCGLCEKVCPEINVEPDTPKVQKAFLVQNKDEQVLSESTSGGFFTAIAECVLENDGVVFGAAFDENFYVKHTFVDNKKELYRFRNSKYVQSDTNDSYKLVEKVLKEDKLVCYSGTPCQIEGLYHYLRKPYDNLILVDVVCRAVPSPLLWEKYLELQSKKQSKHIDNIKFRDKNPYGYRYSQLGIYSFGEQIYNKGVESDQYLRAFFSNICDRPSCYKCNYRKRYRVSDFTIWDCFEVYKYDKKLDNNKGVTRVLLQTKKAETLFYKLEDKLTFVEIEPEKLINNFKEMFNSPAEHERRDSFFEDINTMDIKDCLDKYYPNNVKIAAMKFMRQTMCKIGIYDFVKKSAKKFLKK